MARCPSCGKEWRDELRACPDDGAPLTGDAALAFGSTLESGERGGSLGHRATAPSPGLVVAESFAATADDELEAGAVVADYRVERRLGKGGMGTVYAATHPLIGKRAAIKVMAAELCASAVAVERFLQEARAANTIGHPNIVDVFQFGRMADGRCYLVMEWLDGETLGERLREAGRLPLAEATRVIDAIARALEVAHGKGIIHRDLKPENVFLQRVPDEAPRVKLLDFGIAKLIGDDGRVERTRTGAILGTPLYVSPEQARGQAVDGKTDVYSLGVMLYEMLAGRPPFDAPTAIDVMAMHLSQVPVSLGVVVPGLPAEVVALVDRMLAKPAAERPTLAEVRAVLGAAASGEGAGRLAAIGAAPVAAVARPAAPARGRGRTALAFGVVGALLVAGGAAFLAARDGRGAATAPPDGGAQAVAAVPEVIEVWIDAGPAADATDDDAEDEVETGLVQINCAVAGAMLRIEGAGGPRPLNAEVALEPGVHRFVVIASGYHSRKGEITVEAGAKVELDCDLRRRGGRPKPACDPRNPMCR